MPADWFERTPSPVSEESVDIGAAEALQGVPDYFELPDGLAHLVQDSRLDPKLT